jgi:hypothetical protein
VLLFKPQITGRAQSLKADTVSIERFESWLADPELITYGCDSDHIYLFGYPIQSPLWWSGRQLRQSLALSAGTIAFGQSCKRRPRISSKAVTAISSFLTDLTRRLTAVKIRAGEETEWPSFTMSTQPRYLQFDNIDLGKPDISCRCSRCGQEFSAEPKPTEHIDDVLLRIRADFESHNCKASR